MIGARNHIICTLYTVHHLLFPIFLFILWSLLLEEPPGAPATQTNTETGKHWRYETGVES